MSIVSTLSALSSGLRGCACSAVKNDEKDAVVLLCFAVFIDLFVILLSAFLPG